jgi:hypothetical protein
MTIKRSFPLLLLLSSVALALYFVCQRGASGSLMFAAVVLSFLWGLILGEDYR